MGKMPKKNRLYVIRPGRFFGAKTAQLSILIQGSKSVNTFDSTRLFKSYNCRDIELLAGKWLLIKCSADSLPGSVKLPSFF